MEFVAVASNDQPPFRMRIPRYCNHTHSSGYCAYPKPLRVLFDAGGFAGSVAMFIKIAGFHPAFAEHS